MPAENEGPRLPREVVDRFMDRWTNDPDFAEQLSSDPEAALTSLGIPVFPEQVAYFRELDVDAPAEELRARIAKGVSMN